MFKNKMLKESGPAGIENQILTLQQRENVNSKRLQNQPCWVSIQLVGKSKIAKESLWTK